MRIATTPTIPELFTSLSEGEMRSVFNSKDVAEAANRINAEYYHWDKARRLPRPVGVSANLIWLRAKMSRGYHALSAKGQDGQPFLCTFPSHLLRDLSQIDRLAGHPERFGREVGDEFTRVKERILLDAAMEEAISTSQIEGAVTTRAVAKEMLQAGRPPRDSSEQMIANGFRTMEMLGAQASEPLTFELLNQWQKSMTEGTLDDPTHAGRFRTVNDEPVDVVNVENGDIVYRPPSAVDVEQRMARLVEFANDPGTDGVFLHPLVRASILHFWLAYEHPYNDGNGRTARALFYWYMLRHDYGLFRYITISRVINRSRMQYYRAFQLTEKDENDVTYFVLYMIKVTHQAVKELRAHVAEMIERQRQAAEFFATTGLNRRQRTLLEYALRKPRVVYTFASHAKSNGISALTSRTDLLGLVERGFLVKIRDGKPSEFMAAKDLVERVQRLS